MSSAPYRDDVLALQERLESTERELRARETAQDDELPLLGDARARGFRLLPTAALALSFAGLGALAVLFADGAHERAAERRLLTISSAELPIRRERDGHRCTLRFTHDQLATRWGRLLPMCDTRVNCESVVYDGWTDCGDHRHLSDEIEDEDGVVEIDLLDGTAVVDGERYTF